MEIIHPTTNKKRNDGPDSASEAFYPAATLERTRIVAKLSPTLARPERTVKAHSAGSWAPFQAYLIALAMVAWCLPTFCGKLVKRATIKLLRL
jgi:hypothetical protein